MADNVAGMLAYVTIIPAIIFLVMEPYNKNRFVRFHSFQYLFFSGALIACWIAFDLPFLGAGVYPDSRTPGDRAALVRACIGSFVLWILLLMKANGGQMYKLPMIGDMAEKQANAM